MKVYLDTSCLNRPFDNQRQERIRQESEAVTKILEECEGGEWIHVSSEIAVVEVEANPEKKKRVRAACSYRIQTLF